MPKKKARLGPEDRDQYIRDRIAYWRDRLRVSPSLKVKLKYITNNDPAERNYAQIDRSMIEYDSAVLEVYDEVFAAADFKKTAEETICHEVLHLAMYPLVAFLDSMFTNDEGKQKEVERLEEAVVNVLQKAFTDKG